MKKLALSVVSFVSALSLSHAGQPSVATGKDFKAPLEPVTCFQAQEFQLDVFGLYTDGNAPVHAGPIRDHGWGGGAGLNYFFSRYLGLGADANYLYSKENAAAGDSNNQHNFWSFTGSFILRFPDDATCLAPYVYAGGGYHLDGDKWASGHAGLGVEYRVVPHRVALFTDARWTYFGTRYDHGNQNNFSARAGLRFIF